MAAATHTLDRANSKATYELLSRVKRKLNQPKGNPDGLFLPLDSGSFTPTSVMTDDVDDLIEVLRFPAGYKLYDFQIVSTADVDTGSGALIYDVTAFDGTTHTTLISGCTVGATASGKDEMTRDLGNMLLDVGLQYLTLKITTPANANAGTGALRVKTIGYMGPLVNVNET